MLFMTYPGSSIGYSRSYPDPATQLHLFGGLLGNLGNKSVAIPSVGGLGKTTGRVGARPAILTIELKSLPFQYREMRVDVAPALFDIPLEQHVCHDVLEPVTGQRAFDF